jgi:hypothetical protein
LYVNNIGEFFFDGARPGGISGLRAPVNGDDPAVRCYFSGKFTGKVTRPATNIKANFAWTSRDGRAKPSSLIYDLRS